MRFIREHWVAVLFVVAIIASFVVTKQQAKDADRAQRHQLVDACVRSSQRAALDAAFMRNAAATRRSAGDQQVAASYDADAAGLIRLIPSPPLADENALVEVKYVNGVARLTQSAMDYQRRGCELAFP